MFKCRSLIIVIVSAALYQMDGVGAQEVRIVTYGAKPYASCQKTEVQVEFDSVRSSQGQVYKRSMLPQEELNCVIKMEDLNMTNPNLKTCMEAATKGGYNTFRLDGGSCQVSKVKVRQNVAKSDNLVPVYTANLPVAEQDGSLTFSLDEINEASFKVIVNDTLSSCLSGATYKVSVAGSEEFEVADGEVSGATVPLCIGVELVLTRYLNDVQIGTSSTVTNFTHFGSTFPVNFYIEEVQETSVKVSLMDTSDCAHLASYKMSVNGSEEIAIVDGVVSGGRFSLKSCAEAEFVITRYIGGVLNGEASSLTSLTYGGEIQQDFLQAINQTAAGSELKIEWLGENNCPEIVNSFTVLYDKAFFRHFPGDARSFSIACKNFGKTEPFKVIANIAMRNEVSSPDFTLDTDLIGGLDIPMIYTFTQYVGEKGESGLGVVFSDSFCVRDDAYSLFLTSVATQKMYPLTYDSKMELWYTTALNIDGAKYTLQRLINGIKVGKGVTNFVGRK